jgi:hypothetical protein
MIMKKRYQVTLVFLNNNKNFKTRVIDLIEFTITVHVFLFIIIYLFSISSKKKLSSLNSINLIILFKKNIEYK